MKLPPTKWAQLLPSVSNFLRDSPWCLATIWNSKERKVIFSLATSKQVSPTWRVESPVDSRTLNPQFMNPSCTTLKVREPLAASPSTSNAAHWIKEMFSFLISELLFTSGKESMLTRKKEWRLWRSQLPLRTTSVKWSAVSFTLKVMKMLPRPSGRNSEEKALFLPLALMKVPMFLKPHKWLSNFTTAVMLPVPWLPLKSRMKSSPESTLTLMIHTFWNCSIWSTSGRVTVLPPTRSVMLWVLPNNTSKITTSTPRWESLVPLKELRMPDSSHSSEDGTSLSSLMSEPTRLSTSAKIFKNSQLKSQRPRLWFSTNLEPTTLNLSIYLKEILSNSSSSVKVKTSLKFFSKTVSTFWM